VTSARGHGLALAGIVLGAALVWGVLGQALDVPTVFGDELVYWDAARSLAAGDGLAVREGAFGFGPVYPSLLALVHLLVDDALGAYRVAKAMGAVLFALAAVPVFLLARRTLPPRWALACAALAVGLPSSLYTGLVMTEGAAYLAACIAWLACALVLERPSVARQLWALAAIAVATATRPQLASLGAVLVGALVVRHVLLHGFAVPSTATLRRAWPVVAASIGAVAVAAVRLLAGESLLPGGYEALGGATSAAETARWTWYSLAGLALYLAVVPLVVAPDALVRAVRAGGERAALAALFLAGNAVLLLVVGAFSGTGFGEGRLHDRYLFYVVPLWLVLLAWWAHAGTPVTRAGALVGGGLALLLVLTLPASELLIRDGAVQLDATASGLWAVVGERLGTAALRPGLVAAVLGATSLVLLLRARWRPLVLVALPVVFAVNAAVVWEARVAAARDTVFAPAGTDPGWVDATVSPGADVVTLYAPSDPTVVDGLRLSEFFGARVGRALGVDGATFTPSAPVVTVRFDAQRHLVDEEGAPVHERWVLAAPGLGPLVGRSAATGTTGGLVLWEAAQPVRLAPVGR
jgi:hypothetical protein